MFQIIGIDIMELPRTSSGNCYVLVFQDFLLKWLMVFPVAKQKVVSYLSQVADTGCGYACHQPDSKSIPSSKVMEPSLCRPETLSWVGYCPLGIWLRFAHLCP